MHTGFAFSQAAGQDQLVTELLAEKAKREVERRLTEVIRQVRVGGNDGGVGNHFEIAPLNRIKTDFVR